jgi:hypothetical protein
MHWHECNTHNFLFDSENQTMDFSYTIFPIKKNKCWKNFKIMRKSLFNYSFYSHQISGCDTFPTAGPRQQEPPPMYTLGGSRPPAFQFPATDIPSSSTPPMSQPSTFDTAVEDQLD